jgi:hypothetical protein
VQDSLPFQLLSLLVSFDARAACACTLSLGLCFRICCYPSILGYVFAQASSKSYYLIPYLFYAYFWISVTLGYVIHIILDALCGSQNGGLVATIHCIALCILTRINGYERY